MEHANRAIAKGSDGTCPTVKVAADNEQGFMIIDACAFNAEEHTVFDDGEQVEEGRAAAKSKRSKKNAE